MMIIIHETNQNNFTPIDLGNCVAIEIAKKKRKKIRGRRRKKRMLHFLDDISRGIESSCL